MERMGPDQFPPPPDQPSPLDRGEASRKEEKDEYWTPEREAIKKRREEAPEGEKPAPKKSKGLISKLARETKEAVRSTAKTAGKILSGQALREAADVLEEQVKVEAARDKAKRVAASAKAELESYLKRVGLRHGEQVRVSRSSGGVEEGWRVAAFDKESGKVRVVKEGEGGALAAEKRIPLAEFLTLNPRKNGRGFGGQVDRFLRATKAGLKGAKEGYQEKRAERKAGKKEKPVSRELSPDDVTKSLKTTDLLTDARFAISAKLEMAKDVLLAQAKEVAKSISDKNERRQLLSRIKAFEAEIKQGGKPKKERAVVTEKPAEKRERRRSELTPEQMNEILRKGYEARVAAGKEGYTRGVESKQIKELRPKIEAFEKAREKFAGAEAAYNRSALLGGLLAWTPEAKKRKAAYETARAEYDIARAEYIGEKTWRFLKEKTRVAEAEAERKTKGLGWLGKGIDLSRNFWRKLGEANLEAGLTKIAESREERYELRELPKWAHVVLRAISARTFISLGLFGVGVGLGGSVVGLGALAARRFFSGGGTAFGLYDLMNNFSRIKATSVDDRNISRMGTMEVEKLMANFEGQAMINGHRLVKDKIYLKLRAELQKRAEFDSKIFEIRDRIENSDKEIRAAAGKILKGKLRQGVIAAGAGFLVGSGAIAKAWGGIKELIQGTPAAELTPEDVARATGPRAPALDRDTVQEAIRNEPRLSKPALDSAEQAPSGGGAVRAAAEQPTARAVTPPAETTATERVVTPRAEAPVQVHPETPAGRPVAPRVEAPAGAARAAAEHAAAPPARAAVETFSPAVIERGGNAWEAARSFIGEGSGKINEQEFWAAWGKSSVELPSGARVPIAELGLVHEGDSVVYNAATQTFEIIDSPADQLHIGSNEDLLNAFKAAERPVPQWLQESLHVDNAGNPVRIIEHIDIKPEVIAGPSPELSLRSIDLSGVSQEVRFGVPGVGSAHGHFVYDSFGRVSDVVIEGRGNAATTMQLFKVRDYVDAAEEALREGRLPSGTTGAEAVRGLENRALNIDLMRRITQSVPSQWINRDELTGFMNRRLNRFVEESERLYGDVFKSPQEILRMRN